MHTYTCVIYNIRIFKNECRGFTVISLTRTKFLRIILGAILFIYHCLVERTYFPILARCYNVILFWNWAYFVPVKNIRFILKGSPETKTANVSSTNGC